MLFMNIFDVDVVQNIHDCIPRRPDVDWEVIGGYRMIYMTKHLATYTRGREGGYEYFYKERRPGWCRCNRTWGKGATYTYIDDGILAVRWSGDVEDSGVLPDSYEDYDWVDDEDEVFDILTEDSIQETIVIRDVCGRL